MSSPSPGPPSGGELTYQPSETSDHALLSHSHSCLCPEAVTESQTQKAEQQHCHASAKQHTHHHNVINMSHAPPTPTNHTHAVNQAVHVHVHASPKTGHAPKVAPTACNCHLQSGGGDVDGHDGGITPSRKLEADDSIEVSPLPPALPPRPPPRPRADGHGTLTSRVRPRPSASGGASGGGIRKYVFWCTICGGFATILGALFLAVYFMLRSYTSTLGYFETIPTFVPATMLILTGLCVMSLARRRNRYSYLIKVCGVCCLVCALTCVLVTITTTVIHMNRLQTLRECVYTQRTRTCTCYSVLLEAHTDTDEGKEDMRFVFDSTPDCEVIHGALYSCLRAMFGLSVSGILVCIFSCMLVYQLLSHERKKMYWEQLELRCRSLYQQQGSTISTQGSGRGPPVAPAPYCSCCEECRYPPVPASHVYPWDTHHALDRFWTPGRVGNFYSPNPGEEGPPGPGESRGRERAASGWSWRRLPWSRSNNHNQQAVADNQREANSIGYRGNISSPDSQYGFSNRSGVDPGMMPSTLSDPMTGSTGSYSMLDNRPVGGVYVWGPPPPYSNPNSPARRPIHSPARYHHVHHHPHGHTAHCQMSEESQSQSSSDCQLRRGRSNFPSKDNYENTTESEMHPTNDNSENTDTSSCVERISNNTLPARKSKKRMDILSVKSVVPTANYRTNVQNIFHKHSQPNYTEEQPDQETSEEHSYQEANVKPESGKPPTSLDTQPCRFLPRLQGVENAAFQNQESVPQKTEPTESEVYFADVSSCCNISVRNDGQDSSLYDEALEAQKPRLMSLHCVHKQNRMSENENLVQNNSNTGHSNFQDNSKGFPNVTETEDYLAQRIGKRQMSTRSRLPFPLPNTDNMTLSDLGSESCLQLLSKEISQNSLASSIQTPMTESTDDAISPMSPSFAQNECCLNYFPEKNTNVEQSNRHRTFSNASMDQFLAPDAQYEIIQQQGTTQNFRQNYPEDSSTSNQGASFSNLTNTISGLNNFTNQGFASQNFANNQIGKPVNPNFNSNFNPSSPKNIPPKTLNINSSPRRGIGSNISTLIQNLGVNPVGLLYGEANSTDEEVQGQACHSDGTMDSGWQSGSEKQDINRSENADPGVPRPVNV